MTLSRLHNRSPAEPRKGIIPEVGITHRRTGKQVFFEVKKQGPRGNAEERAAKHHTRQFYTRMNELLGFEYHPFVTIMCESLATDERYTRKFPDFYEPGQYFLWADYNIDSLEQFLLEMVRRFELDKE